VTFLLPALLPNRSAELRHNMRTTTNMEGSSANSNDDKNNNNNNGLGVIQDSSNPQEQGVSVSPAPDFSAGSADDARSSVSSEKSDSRPPRSAMRRSSSIPKSPQSPRRVRFDFMGEEVLPTTSPQPSAFISARIPSPDPIDDGINCTSNLATERGEEDDEGDEVQTSFRKVSSSDALRALSRTPLEEDGTVWTVINSGEDEAAPEQPHSEQDNQPEAAATASPSTTPTDLKSTPLVTTVESNNNKTIAGDIQAGSSGSDNDLSDDNFISMAEPKSPVSPVSPVSRVQALLAPPKATQRATLSQPSNKSVPPQRIRKPALDRRSDSMQGTLVGRDDDGELFHFEEDGLQLPEGPRRAQESSPEQEDLDAEHSDSEESSDNPTPQPLSLYATSPAVPITRAADRDREPDPPTPSRAKFESNTVGSYKGRPLTMPVMRNPELLAQLESSQPINEVVGSVHHRGPTDDFNPVGYEEAAKQAMTFGAPRSFSERLMIEDMMEAAKARSAESQGAPAVQGQ
jgi:hypothetical protein